MSDKPTTLEQWIAALTPADVEKMADEAMAELRDPAEEAAALARIRALFEARLTGAGEETT